MAKTDRAVIKLLFDILAGKTGEISRVDYKPQKPEFDSYIPIRQAFLRAEPESVGVPSGFVYNLLSAIAGLPDANIHHFMLLRHDKVICEASFAPYRNGDWHISHSMCKSITGMAIGILIGEDRLSLDDKVVDIFNDHANVLTWFKKRDITVRHLLTMTSGIDFAESGALSGNHWIESYLNAGLKFTPGSQFSYNSMNSYMLSAIVTKKTGKSMFDFLKERLFTPMGIDEVFWEASPEGITKGGWGLFIRPEDAAKLGTLYLRGGRWNGEQLVPEAWVLESVKNQIGNIDRSNSYGYQIWPGAREGSFTYNGMMGQNVKVYPDLDMILVTNAGDPEVFQDGSMDKVISGFLDKKTGFENIDFMPANPLSYGNLKKLASRLEDGSYFNPNNVAGGWERRQPAGGIDGRNRYSSWNRPHPSKHDFFVWLSGRTYKLDACHYGLFPITLQTFHNNFTDGIEKIGFEYIDHVLYTLFYEGDTVQRIAVGFRKSLYSVVDEHGEHYTVGTHGEFTDDEDHNRVLKLKIAFIEEASSRIVTIHFNREDIVVEMDEIPGKMLIMGGLEFSVTGVIESNVWLNNSLGHGAEKVLRDAILATIMPSIGGTLIKSTEETKENEV